MTERMFHPNTKRIPIVRGGRIDSKDLSTFVDNVVNDLMALKTIVADLYTKGNQEALKTKLQESDLRERVEQLTKELLSTKKAATLDGDPSSFALSFHDSSVVTHLDDSPDALRAQVDSVFGLATVPMNAIEHRFVIQNLRTGTFSQLPDLQVEVTGTFDAGDGDGLVDHEGGEVETGIPEQAFNGNNTQRWVRRVEFDLEDDTTEVMTEITATIPQQASSIANLVYVIPFPEGELDIVGIYTSPDLSNSFSLLDDFEEVKAAGPKKWFFPAQEVQRLKIRFRQRNWVEEDGKKVFYVGAQEIGLDLVDFDKTYEVDGEPTDNHTVVLVAQAPSGSEFTKIKKVFTEPDFTLETAGQRHIHIKLSRAADGSDVVWDSDDDSLPQDMVGGLTITATDTLYWIVSLNYVGSSGGPSSPFPVGTTPYISTIMFQADTEESA